MSKVQQGSSLPICNLSKSRFARTWSMCLSCFVPILSCIEKDLNSTLCPTDIFICAHVGTECFTQCTCSQKHVNNDRTQTQCTCLHRCTNALLWANISLLGLHPTTLARVKSRGEKLAGHLRSCGQIMRR